MDRLTNKAIKQIKDNYLGVGVLGKEIGYQIEY